MIKISQLSKWAMSTGSEKKSVCKTMNPERGSALEEQKYDPGDVSA